MTGAPFDWTCVADVAALPVLRANEVHVVRARFPDAASPIVAPMWQHVSAGELERAGRLHSESDRQRFVFARGFVRQVLGGALHADPAALVFDIGKGGKPALGGVRAQSGLAFNLSHSGDWVVIAVARGMHVGIDIEQIRPAFRAGDIAGRYFSAAENAALTAVPEAQRVRAFFDGWTRKEAYVKARGAGIQLGLDTFSVSLAPDAPVAFLSGVEPQWTLIAFDLDPQTPGALVHDCPGARVVPLSVEHGC
jgi:4'-phosphopantetheinyl transferase